MGLTYNKETGRPYAARNAKLWCLCVGDWVTFIPATTPRRALFDALDGLLETNGKPDAFAIEVRVATRIEVESYVQRHPGTLHPDTLTRLLSQPTAGA